MLTRPARPQDIVRMIEIERRSATAAHWTERDYNAIFAEVTPRRIALVAELERSEILAQESGNQVQHAPEPGVCGFIVARCFEGDWEIENVAVAPEARQRGLGAGLLRAILDRARHEGASRLYLEVRGSNLPARKLYEKLGFITSGYRKNYYSNPPEDALLLELAIGQYQNL